MNKKGFIEKLAENSEISKKEAARNTDAFLKTLVDCLKEDGMVKLVGFGKFELKTFGERIARNVRTGESCIVPEHKKVKFYASGALADKVRNE